MIQIKTSWNGIVGIAETHKPKRLYIEGQTVAHAVSKLVKRLEKGHSGKAWQDDNGTRGVVGQHKPKKAGKVKPSQLPQIENLDGKMNGFRHMKEDR